MNKKKMFLNAAMIGLLAGSLNVYAEGTPNKNMNAALGECHGVNSCKGSGECAGKTNECSGKNSCKGQGWTKLSKKDCKKQKGTYKPMAKM